MQQNKTLYIVRGLPGSGKSTYAQSLGVPYFEADMYFYKNGKYEFDRNKLHRAHTWCFDTLASHIHCRIDVAVSNTFTTVKEITPYVELARQNDYQIVIIEVKTHYGSIHSVPEETMEKMRARWQEVTEDMYDEKKTIE